MIYKVLAIRDRAADVFAQPIFAASVGAVIRGFSDQINGADPNSSVLSVHPEDFDLYELGEFDDGFARFVLLDPPRQVAIGKDLVRPKN